MNTTNVASEYRIHGLKSEEDVALLKRTFADIALRGNRLSFDLPNGIMRIVPPDAVGDETIAKKVAAAGMRAERISPQTPLPGG